MTVSTHINLRGDWDLNRHALAMTPVDIISFRFLITPSLYAHRKKLGSLHSFQGVTHSTCRRRARNPSRRSGRSRRPQTRQAAPRHLHRRRCSSRGAPGLSLGLGFTTRALLRLMWMHALEHLSPNSTCCRCLRARRSSIMSGRSTTAVRSWPSSAVLCARVLLRQ